MMVVSRHDSGKISTVLLTVTVGLGLTIVAPDISSAKPKNPIYNECACACYTPASGFGTILDIRNNAGVACELYNNRPCTGTDENGATISGTTKYCGGYKPGGTRAMHGAAVPSKSLSVMSRGVEGGEPAASQDAETAVLMSQPGNVMMSCSCQGGKGSCSVTSTDGKTSTCHKGDGDTCTGSCAYPKGTISGAE